MVCDDCSGDTNIKAPPYQLSYGSDDEFIRHRKLKNFIQRKCMKSPGNSRWFENYICQIERLSNAGMTYKFLEQIAGRINGLGLILKKKSHSNL